MTWSGIVDDLLDELGDALRYAARYDADGYERLYVRGDVQDRRSREIYDNAYLEARYEDAERPYLEEQLDAGALGTVVHSFEQLLLCNFIYGDDEGLLVSVNRDAEVDLHALLDRFEHHEAVPTADESR